MIAPFAELLLDRHDDALERLHLLCDLLEHGFVSFLRVRSSAPADDRRRVVFELRAARRRGSGGRRARPPRSSTRSADRLGDVRRARSRRARRDRRSCARRGAPCRTRAPTEPSRSTAAAEHARPVVAQARRRARARAAQSSAFVRRADLARRARDRAGLARAALDALAHGARSPRRARAPGARATSTGGSDDVQVDAIEERPAELRAVRADALGRARAARRAVARAAARARVHRADEQRPRGERGLAVGARDGDDARPRAAGAAPRARPRRNSGSSSRKSTPWCARLTSPGRGPLAAADEADLAHGVVRRAERARARERASATSSPATLWIAVHLERLVGRERRQEARAGGARASSCRRRAGRS